MEASLLRYPKKSHRKIILYPEESVRLAELMGIEFGDGGINNPWQVVITLNADKDGEYGKYITDLIEELFKVTPAVRVRGERALQIVLSSTSVVDYLVKKGAVRGNKIKQDFDIPCWIRENKENERAFVRGLVDTDGCLYIHRHEVGSRPYKNIGLCFTSGSKNLLRSVADIFSGNGIIPHIADQGRRIYLYDENSVVQYLRTFGSSNPRITEVYEEWRGA